jgi:Lrp/AsnC family leucine-responsive transcriptional regulator
MDEMDLRIVKLLSTHGRISHEEIGKGVHLSRPAVFERIKRLEAKGIIYGYGAKVDWEAIGLPLTAFVWVRYANKGDTTGRKIAGIEVEGAVLEDLYRVTGEWCLFAKYHVASPAALQRILDQIRSFPEVQNTMTTIALSSLVEGQERRMGDPALPSLAG